MKTNILRAAMELFLKSGFEKVTIRNIADKICYSPATIYKSFKTKNHIFFELRTQGFELLYKKQLETRSIADPIKRLKEHSLVYMRFALANPEYYELMFILKGPMKHLSDNSHWTETKKSIELLHADVESVVSAGYLRANEVERAVNSLWFSFHGIVSLKIQGRLTMYSEGETPAMIEETADYIFNRLFPKLHQPTKRTRK